MKQDPIFKILYMTLNVVVSILDPLKPNTESLPTTSKKEAFQNINTRSFIII
jgi:hypothetical protein